MKQKPETGFDLIVEGWYQGEFFCATTRPRLLFAFVL